MPDEKGRKKVRSLAAVGIPQNEIAAVLGIDKKTLGKYYRQEIDESMTMANAAVAGKLYAAAMAGSVSAQIFWCKTRLKWRETDRVEHTGIDGGDIASTIRVEFVGVDDE